MHTDQTNNNIASDVALSPVKVADIVIKDYLAKRSLKGFHTLECNLKNLLKKKLNKYIVN